MCCLRRSRRQRVCVNVLLRLAIYDGGGGLLRRLLRACMLQGGLLDKDRLCDGEWVARVIRRWHMVHRVGYHLGGGCPRVRWYRLWHLYVGLRILRRCWV